MGSTGIRETLAAAPSQQDVAVSVADFSWQAHADRLDAIYSGPDEQFVGRWKGYFPFDPTRNQAYYALVRTRVGNLESAHSLPVRAFWNLGDPAARVRPLD